MNLLSSTLPGQQLVFLPPRSLLRSCLTRPPRSSGDDEEFSPSESVFVHSVSILACCVVRPAPFFMTTRLLALPVSTLPALPSYAHHRPLRIQAIAHQLRVMFGGTQSSAACVDPRCCSWEMLIFVLSSPSSAFSLLSPRQFR